MLIPENLPPAPRAKWHQPGGLTATFLFFLHFFKFYFIQGLSVPLTVPELTDIDQAGLELTESTFIYLPNDGVKGMLHQCPA